MTPGVYIQVRDLGLPKRPVIVRPPVSGDSGPPPTPSIVEDGLLFYLDANTLSPGNEMTDLSGNNRNGETTFGTTFSTDGGGSLALSGPITIDNTVDLRRDFSLEIWVRFNSLENRQDGLFSQLGTRTANQLLGILQYNTYSISYYMWFNDFAINPTPTTISNNVWYHYLFTYSHSSPYTKAVYRNGQLMGQSTTGQSQYQGTGTLQIGTAPGSGLTTYPLNGSVAIVRAYSKILNLSEINQNYDAEKSRFGY